MLQDPEKPFEEWSYEIGATNLKTAWSQCKYIADSAGLTEVLNVSQKSKTPGRKGMYRFICWFRSEKSEEDI